MACGHTVHYRRLQETTGDYRRSSQVKLVDQVNQVRAVAFSSRPCTAESEEEQVEEVSQVNSYGGYDPYGGLRFV